VFLLFEFTNYYYIYNDCLFTSSTALVYVLMRGYVKKDVQNNENMDELINEYTIKISVPGSPQASALHRLVPQHSVHCFELVAVKLPQNC
jgi:hypothetical protein